MLRKVSDTLTRNRNSWAPGWLRKLSSRSIPPRFAIPLRDRFGGERDAEIGLVKKLVLRDSVAVDVGAHNGSYTYKLSKLVGVRGLVYSFVPEPTGFKYISDGFKSTQNVILSDLALSSQSGKGVFKIPKVVHGISNAGATLNSSTEFFTEMEISTTTLDSLGLKNVSLIKIDVEGHELEVLKGAQETIKSNKPHLLIEIFRGCTQQNSSEIWKILNSCGISNCRYISEGRLWSLTNTQYLGLIETRPLERSYNFIFSPAD